MNVKYYECHITIEPVFDEDLNCVSEIALKHGFKLADLLMQKRRQDKPERSKKDTFCTAHSKSYDDIFEKMKLVCADIQNGGYKVWRSKIEAVLYDERFEK